MRWILSVFVLVTFCVGCDPQGPEFSVGDSVTYKVQSTEAGPARTATGTVVSVQSVNLDGKTVHLYRIDMGLYSAHITDKDKLPLVREDLLRKAAQ